jgi:alpha-beta hydrolase superfamily lysophospholipase
MTRTHVLFVQGGGKGAHREDAALAASLERALGGAYEVHFPRMPDEADPNVQSWKRKIAVELSRLPGKVLLVGHSVGGAMLLRYLSEDDVGKPSMDCSCSLPHPGTRTSGISTISSCRTTSPTGLLSFRASFSTIAATMRSSRLPTSRSTRRGFRGRQFAQSTGAAINSETT